MNVKSFIIVATYFSAFSIAAQQKSDKEIDLDKFVQHLFGQQNLDIKYEDFYENVFQYYRSPLDLNKATRDQLESLYLLSPLQIQNFIKYRSENGSLLSIYELQVIPGFNENVIESILPFVKVDDKSGKKDSRTFWQQVREEENHYLITKVERTLEPQKGFIVGDTNNKAFQGDRNKIYLRYRLYNKERFSIGLTSEKDQGEALAWNPALRQYGMDFNSAHFALFNKGKVKSVIVGDYNIQVGQGLVMAAGFYIGKGAETVTTIKRSNSGIKPYTGSMEFGFLRGVATTISMGRFDFTSFYSHKNEDANIGGTDTISFATSIYQTGYHRSSDELKRKGAILIQTGGGILSYQTIDKSFKIGINAVYNAFNPEIRKLKRVYNQFDFNGSENYNIGGDFNYYWQNLNFFAEYSRSRSGGNAVLAGVLGSLHPTIDFSFLFRNYDRDFHSIYGNAFGEISNIKNEQGFYWGIKFTPVKKLIFSGYYDKFYFPWLTLRADGPVNGSEFFIRSEYKPLKKVSLFCQLRQENKPINLPENNSPLDIIVESVKRSYAINFDYSSEKLVSLKSRIQFSTYKQEGREMSYGTAVFQDINFNINKKIKISTRAAIFDTEDYNNRQYVYETNVFWSFSMPLYYGTGLRNYVMIQYKANKNLDIWLRLARFDYKNVNSMGSGLTEISGNAKTDLTVQIKYDF